MPERKFSMEAGGLARVVCAWDGLQFQNFRVTLDGMPVGGFPDKQALMRGGVFPLPDGSQLSVQFVQGIGSAGLHINRNGVPLPGSDGDPVQAGKNAAGVVYFLGALNLALGLAAAGGVQLLVSLGLGWANVAMGVLYLVLAYLTGRGQRLALAAATAIFAIDGVLSIAVSMGDGRTPPIAGIVFRVFVVFALINTLKVMGAKPAAAPPQR